MLSDIYFETLREEKSKDIATITRYNEHVAIRTNQILY